MSPHLSLSLARGRGKSRQYTHDSRRANNAQQHALAREAAVTQRWGKRTQEHFGVHQSIYIVAAESAGNMECTRGAL